MERISSRQNAIVTRFRDVARGDGTSDSVLLDGRHLLEEALASGTRVAVVAVIEPLASGPLASLAADARRAGAEIFIVTEQVLAAVSPVRHPSGIVAIAHRPRATLEDVLGSKQPLVLILREVQDPGNVGAIVRAAEGCGATGIITTEGTADPFGWKALRGAMGSTFRLPVAARHSLEDAVRRARGAGLRVIATTARQGTPLPACDLRGPSAILLGGEGAGLPPDVEDAADERVTIPMTKPIESLNVAIAAAIVLYEASRQRSRMAQGDTRGSRSANGDPQIADR